MNCYTVFKKTASHADAFAAIGVADMLRHLDPRILDFEDRFEIWFRRKLVRADLDAVDPGFSYLEIPKKRSPKLPPERIVQLRPPPGAGQTPASSENRMYSILSRMKAFGGPNQLVSRFAKMSREDWGSRVWDSLRGNPKFIFSWPLVQLFNPHSGRGYALLKPAGTGRSDKTKDRWAEPFHEWLRYRGYFEGAAGWFTSGDLRLFCPIPADLRYDELSSAIAAFRQLHLGGTSAKMDCRAVLGFTRLLIENAKTYRRPRQSVQGLWAAHYKDMGQAHAIISIEQLATPDWFDLGNSQQERLWLSVLEEHDTVLRRLTDSHSDEFTLLKQYRRTFQTKPEESIQEFVRFMAEYGALLFRRRAQDHWILPQLTAKNAAPVLKGDPSLEMVLRNPGFVAVAAAVRSSTVGAQVARRNGNPDHREIRYGLLSDVLRAGNSGNGELMRAVSGFVSQFNQEASRRRKAGVGAMQIKPAEMDAFEALLDLPAGRVPVAPLLCGMSACLPGAGVKVEADPEVLQAASA